MATYKVFSIYDVKAEAYLSPFFMNTVGEAMRAFKDLVNDPRHRFGAHPADYTLFQIASWDDSSARFEPLKVPVPLAPALELVDRAPTPLFDFSEAPAPSEAKARSA